MVSTHLTWDARGLRGRPSGDGIITITGTFQKFYTQHELRTWVEETEPWICEKLYEQHHEALAPLVEFLTHRGRLPHGNELV